MRHAGLSFAAGKPAFRRQENKNQDQRAKNVPLPRIAGVIPKKHLSDRARQIAHVGIDISYQAGISKSHASIRHERNDSSVSVSDL